MPEEYAEACAAQQMSAMALLDRDGMYGAPRFYFAAKKLNIRAHIGAEITSLLKSPPNQQMVGRATPSSSDDRVGIEGSAGAPSEAVFWLLGRVISVRSPASPCSAPLAPDTRTSAASSLVPSCARRSIRHRCQSVLRFPTNC